MNTADTTLPMSYNQIVNFPIYQHEIPSLVNQNDRYRYSTRQSGDTRSNIGIYSIEYRSCAKRYLQQSARIWIRAAKSWIYRRCLQGQQDYVNNLGWTRMRIKVNGTKEEIIKSLKLFVDACPQASTLLKDFIRPLILSSGSQWAPSEQAFNSCLRQEMRISDSQSQEIHVYYINYDMEQQAQQQPPQAQPPQQAPPIMPPPQAQPIMPPPQAQQPLEVIDPITGYVFDDSDIIARNLLELFMAEEGNQSLTDDQLTSRFIDFMNYMNETERVEEENPLEKLAPEPELPDYLPDKVKNALICPITYEVFRDPVIDPEGHTYEKVAIMEHLRTNHCSPITREKLEQKDLISNRILKDTIQALVATSK